MVGQCQCRALCARVDLLSFWAFSSIPSFATHGWPKSVPFEFWYLWPVSSYGMRGCGPNKMRNLRSLSVCNAHAGDPVPGRHRWSSADAVVVALSTWEVLFPERTDMREQVIMDCENWLMLTETDWLHVMALTLCFFHVSTCAMSPCISCMPYAVRYSLLALPKRLELVPRHGRKGGRFSPVVVRGRLVSVSCFHSLYYFFGWLPWIGKASTLWNH